MRRRRARTSMRAVGGATATAFVGTLALSGCASAPEPPIPGQWEGFGGVVTLYADGKGELEGVPVGPGSSCDPDVFQPFEGAVEWEESEPGTIHVEAGDDVVTLWADRGGFGGDISWWKIAVGPCGDETPGADVVTYTRNTKFPSND